MKWWVATRQDSSDEELENVRGPERNKRRPPKSARPRQGHRSRSHQPLPPTPVSTASSPIQRSPEEILDADQRFYDAIDAVVRKTQEQASPATMSDVGNATDPTTPTPKNAWDQMLLSTPLNMLALIEARRGLNAGGESRDLVQAQ
jgi:hypothetical protein